ncbi:hypothetical protein [Prauserella aidingensis]|uniref:hypothetical protein n=1 Tax=Prauserella aidingensis TaxID=387890 RepID=UPI0020A4C47B|nr:hypothetical protein [Prauserella aidingensis]
MADYYDIPVPQDAQVTRRVQDTTGRGLGFDKVVRGHSDSSATEEITETYESKLRPVKLLNDIIDQLSESQHICDLVDDRGPALMIRQPIIAEGEITLAPASEVGEVMAKLLPLFYERAAEGQFEGDPSRAELASQFFAQESQPTPYVMCMDVEDAEQRFFLS